MELNLTGKVALVTAASRGIGKAIATELSREGARVVICSRDEERVETAAREIKKETGNLVTPLVGDVGRLSDIQSLMTHIKDEHGQLDVLVCNAGGPPGGPFDAFGDEDWQAAFETNLLSVVRLVRESLPLMKDAGGKILAVASSSVKVPIPGLILSNVMRAGVGGLMKTLANELAEYGILVNTVCPGRIATDRIVELDEDRAKRLGLSEAEVRKRSVAQIPLGRYGDPQEFARVAAFLASDANSYVTGSTLMIDGGMVQAL